MTNFTTVNEGSSLTYSLPDGVHHSVASADWETAKDIRAQWEKICAQNPKLNLPPTPPLNTKFSRSKKGGSENWISITIPQAPEGSIRFKHRIGQKSLNRAFKIAPASPEKSDTLILYALQHEEFGPIKPNDYYRKKSYTYLRVHRKEKKIVYKGHTDEPVSSVRVKWAIPEEGFDADAYLYKSKVKYGQQETPPIDIGITLTPPVFINNHSPHYQIEAWKVISLLIYRGIDLQKYLQGKHSRKTLFSLARQACQIVDNCHKKGILINDFKTNNLTVEKSGQLHLIDDEALVRVADLELFDEVMRTKGYAAPELEDNRRSADYATFKSDIYSLGKVLRDILGDLPNELDKYIIGELIKKVTEHDPEDRLSLEVIIDVLDKSEKLDSHAQALQKIWDSKLLDETQLASIMIDFTSKIIVEPETEESSIPALSHLSREMERNRKNVGLLLNMMAAPEPTDRPSKMMIDYVLGILKEIGGKFDFTKVWKTPADISRFYYQVEALKILLDTNWPREHIDMTEDDLFDPVKGLDYTTSILTQKFGNFDHQQRVLGVHWMRLLKAEVRRFSQNINVTELDTTDIAQGERSLIQKMSFLKANSLKTKGPQNSAEVYLELARVRAIEYTIQSASQMSKVFGEASMIDFLQTVENEGSTLSILEVKALLDKFAPEKSLWSSFFTSKTSESTSATTTLTWLSFFTSRPSESTPATTLEKTHSLKPPSPKSRVEFLALLRKNCPAQTASTTHSPSSVSSSPSRHTRGN